MQQYVSYHENGVKKEEGLKARDLKTGYWKSWDENGKLTSEGRYIQGMKNGLWKYLGKDNTRVSVNFVDGAYDGLYLKLHNDQILDMIYYSMGKLHGLSIKYYQNGKKLHEGHYKYSLKVGVWKEWHSNGRYKFIGEYDNDGKPLGIHRSWYSNGQISEEITYVDKAIHGHWTKWYYTGDLEEVMEYKNGKLEGPTKDFYENGVMRSIIHYKNSMKDGLYEHYFENGSLKERGSYKNSTKDGFWTAWNPNGTISYKGSYTSLPSYPYLYEYLDGDDRKVGEWEFYDLDGRICSKGEFDEEGLETGTWKTWYPNGNLESVSEYYEGELIWISRWTEDGVLVKNETENVIDQTNNLPVEIRRTETRCIILMNDIPAGSKYYLCSFSDEHVHGFDIMNSFLSRSRQTELKCQYCSNLFKNVVYQQPEDE